MGVINLTPDSFSDGGRWDNPISVEVHAHSLWQAGANVLDLGAESTRPGAVSVSSATEQERLLPVLRQIVAGLPSAIISVDTRNSATARVALNHGAAIINDVSGLAHDTSMRDVLREYKPGYVLMHSQGTPATMQFAPSYDNVVDEVKKFFESHLNELCKIGLPENRIVLDPGIGFGKTLAHNLDLLRHVEDFLIFGRPLLVGLSRKSFFGQLLKLPLERRDGSTATAAAILFNRGVQWHRVHNVAATRQSLELAKMFNANQCY